jgi:ketosteroid isomerase-like protein
MSRENVEVVREVWNVFERGGFPSELFDENAEWHTAEDLPDTEICRGHAAIQRMLATGWENVLDPGLRAEELLDADDRVLVRWRGWGTGRGSGVPIEWHEAHAYELRDGMVVTVREYRTWDEALADSGAPPNE